MAGVDRHVPSGHPYSPIPSPDDVVRARARADATRALPGIALPGIDLRTGEQLALLRQLAAHYGDLPFSDEPGSYRFGYANTWFSHADAVLMALMVMHARPNRIIEVGCGHSSALLLDINDLFFDGTLDLTFIDPDAERVGDVVRSGDLAGRLLECVVQDVPVSTFELLRVNDILAIDSSHVLKAGSDVQYLLDEVLPALVPGVLIHVHDVFYPFEYPQRWLDAGVAFTEAYAIRLLLQHSTAYRIELFTDYLLTHHAEAVARACPRAVARPFETGGIWLRRL